MPAGGRVGGDALRGAGGGGHAAAQRGVAAARRAAHAEEPRARARREHHHRHAAPPGLRHLPVRRLQRGRSPVVRENTFVGLLYMLAYTWYCLNFAHLCYKKCKRQVSNHTEFTTFVVTYFGFPILRHYFKHHD